MSSATIGSLNVTINRDFNYCMIHCFLNNVSMCYPITFYFYFMWKKKINMPRNVNFLWCSKQVTGPYIFWRLIIYLLPSVNSLRSEQSTTLELVVKAENLKGNKIQAVIEYTNGTRSKIGRTAQKKSLIHLNYKSWRGAWKETKRYNSGGGGEVL